MFYFWLSNCNIVVLVVCAATVQGLLRKNQRIENFFRDNRTKPKRFIFLTRVSFGTVPAISFHLAQFKTQPTHQELVHQIHQSGWAQNIV